jgi:DNA ligase-associated metallophosphoesterase
MTQPKPVAECRLLLCETELVLDASGALWWPGEKTVVVADLHFEKGSAYARSGQFLPPYDTRATIRRLETLLARTHAQRVIALGDSFHDSGAGGRLDEEERAALSDLTRRYDFFWVEGNHDPEPPSWLGGRIVPEMMLNTLMFRHIPGEAGIIGEVAGHLHPAVRVSRGGVSVRRRCFVSDGRRLLLPAFGAYTGGLDVQDEAVTTLFTRGHSVYALGKERAYLVKAVAA